MHDVHSRLTPKQAVVLARALEPYHLAFLEDVIAPEHYDRLPEVRAASPVPIAVGEQIGSVTDAVRLVRDGGVDLLRLHTSSVGGLTPTRKIVALAELLGVRTTTPADRRRLWELVAAGFRLPAGSIAALPLEQAAEAHARIQSGGQRGHTLLTVGPS